MGVKKITRRVGRKGQHESLIKTNVFTPESTEEAKEMLVQFNAENALDFRFAKFEQFFKSKLIEQGLPFESLVLVDKPDDEAACSEMLAEYVEKYNVNACFFSALKTIFLKPSKSQVFMLEGLLKRIAPENKTAEYAAKALRNLQSAKSAYETGSMEIAMRHMLSVLDDMHVCIVADMEPRWHAGKERMSGVNQENEKRKEKKQRWVCIALDKYHRLVEENVLSLEDIYEEVRRKMAEEEKIFREASTVKKNILRELKTKNQAG